MSFILAHSIVTAQQVSANQASKTALVLHGALGSGQNFRGFIRKLVERRPDYRFVLVDLRSHGRSNPAPPPHTLANAAADLAALAGQVGLGPDQPLHAIVGHSLGGKVAFEYARQYDPAPTQLWALDSDPGSQAASSGHEILRVMAAVRAVPLPIETRQDVVTSLLEQGLPSGLANWMTTNILRVREKYRWSFDLDAIEQLVADYFERDLWPYLESPPEGRAELNLVVAEQSDRFTPETRRRAEALAAEKRIRLHSIPNAGHWLHVDNPRALLELLERHLA